MLLLTVMGAMLLACAGVVLAQDTTTPASSSQAGEVVPDQYIVVLKESIGQDAEQVASDHARRHGSKVRHVYKNARKGYAAKIPKEQVAAVRSDDRVAYVEPDQVMTVTRQALPWGINKMDADVSSTKAGNRKASVSNVNVYVIDTGIDASISDLNVVNHVNFAGGQNTDCHGHGTHVAGTVAASDNRSTVVGGAPGAPLTGVKVLGCDGSGLTSDIIEAVDWVTANAKKPAIVNMSLGGGASLALDLDVKSSANSGIFYVVAAGNDGKNACNYSPARAGAGTDNGIVTVAATDWYDGEASFSNYGSCVDAWAPGVSITSTGMGSGTETMSGTSMASPHVGGGVALYLSKNTSASPTSVESRLKADSVATGTKSNDGTAIKRLYAGKY